MDLPSSAEAMLNLKTLSVLVFGSALVFSVGCGPQQQHPNQLSTFDGASYDSMTVAHAALISLRTTVGGSYPQYVPGFDQAAASYAIAYNAYAAYRLAPASEASAALAISNLTVSIVNLENTLQVDMHVKPNTVQQIRGRALRMRAAVAPKITISDILTELEIAASVAQTVPGTQPYSTIAAVVIKTTQEALAAYQSASGQPIDLTTIQPVAQL